MKLTDLKEKYKNQWVVGSVKKKKSASEVEEVDPKLHSHTRTKIESKLTKTTDRQVAVIYTGEVKPRI